MEISQDVEVGNQHEQSLSFVNYHTYTGIGHSADIRRCGSALRPCLSSVVVLSAVLALVTTAFRWSQVPRVSAPLERDVRLATVKAFESPQVSSQAEWGIAVEASTATTTFAWMDMANAWPQYDVAENSLKTAYDEQLSREHAEGHTAVTDVHRQPHWSGGRSHGGIAWMPDNRPWDEPNSPIAITVGVPAVIDDGSHDIDATTVSPRSTITRSTSSLGVVQEPVSTTVVTHADVVDAPAAPARNHTIVDRFGFHSVSVDRGVHSTHHTTDTGAAAMFSKRSSTTAMTSTSSSTNVIFTQNASMQSTTQSPVNSSIGNTTTAVVPSTTSVMPRMGLFCFAVTMPFGDELALLRALFVKGVSIFACDQYSVFSDGEIELGPGPPARITTQDVGSMKCPYGGKWNLALNSEVFVKIWRWVFIDQKYDRCDWTVKVDPDAVFIPDRLRIQVASHDPHSAMYFNNCDQGLHGPIEVLSHAGMEVFFAGISKCVDVLKHEWGEYGEDVFLKHCLGTLNVKRVDNFRLLSEDRCFYENPKMFGCTSGKVSFHPFKDVASWWKCWYQATTASAVLKK